VTLNSLRNLSDLCVSAVVLGCTITNSSVGPRFRSKVLSVTDIEKHRGDADDAEEAQRVEMNVTVEVRLILKSVVYSR
jgi:hypothetical protein